jgi:hypothetical protein
MPGLPLRCGDAVSRWLPSQWVRTTLLGACFVSAAIHDEMPHRWVLSLFFVEGCVLIAFGFLEYVGSRGNK